MTPSIFQFQAEQSVRVEFQNNEPLFCLTDVARILEISNANPLRFNMKRDGVHKMYSVDTKGRKNEITYINEPNLYRVIFRSNKPEAVKFQDWIFEEVIPQIRKTGSYGAGCQATDDLTVLKLTAEKISAEAGKLKAEAEAAHLKYELAKLKQFLPKSEAAMPSEDLLQAPQAPVSPQKAFILEQPEGSVFAMDVSGCSVRFIRLDGLTWICLKDLCNACGMAWGAQLRSLGIGFGHRISLHRGSHAIFVSQDEAFDYLNQRNTNRVRHPEKLSDTRTFVKNLI